MIDIGQWATIMYLSTIILIFCYSFYLMYYHFSIRKNRKKRIDIQINVLEKSPFLFFWKKYKIEYVLNEKKYILNKKSYYDIPIGINEVAIDYKNDSKIILDKKLEKVGHIIDHVFVNFFFISFIFLGLDTFNRFYEVQKKMNSLTNSKEFLKNERFKQEVIFLYKELEKNNSIILKEENLLKTDKNVLG